MNKREDGCNDGLNNFNLERESYFFGCECTNNI